MCGDCGNIQSDRNRVKDLSWPSPDTIATVRMYQDQLQLNSGWNTMRTELLQYEMLVAAARSGIRLEYSYFVIPNPHNGELERLQFERWQLFLCKTLAMNCSLTGSSFGEHFSQMADGSYRVRLHSVATASMLAACQCKGTSNGFLLCVAFAIINTAIPLLMRFCVSHHRFSPGSSAEVVLYYTCTSFLNLFMFVALMSFLYGAVLDVVRRFLLSDVLQHLIRLVDIDLRPKLRMEAVPMDKTEHRQMEKKLIRRALQFSQPLWKGSPNDTCGANDVEANAMDKREYLLSREKSQEGYVSKSSQDWSPHYREDVPTRGMYSESLEPFATDVLQDQLVPQLDLTIPSNYTAFLQCRKMLHNFGFRVRFRLDTYTGAVIIAVDVECVLPLL